MNLVSAKQSAIKLDKEVSAMQYLDNKLEYLNYKMYHLPYLSANPKLQRCTELCR